MYIKRAHKDDLPAIKALIQESGKFTFFDSCLNKRDLSYCVRDESGELAAFIWCGLMANNKVAHIDYLCVNPKFSKQNISRDLSLHVFKELAARGVKYAHASSLRDEHQIKLLKELQKSPGASTAKATPGLILEWSKE